MKEEFHPFTRIALSAVEGPHDHMDIAEHILYVDGSFEIEEGSAWCVAVLGKSNQGGIQYLGGFGGRTITDSSDARWVGAHHHSAATAEASAMIWAQLWVIRRPVHQRQIPAVIIGDSLTTGTVAQLLATPKANQELGRLLQGLQLYANARGSLRWEWIKGHSLHPWNELVDVGAKWYLSLIHI